MATVNCVSFLFLILFGCALSIPMGMPSYFYQHQYPVVSNNIRFVPMQHARSFQRSSYGPSYMDTSNDVLSDNDRLFLQGLRKYNVKRNEARYSQQESNLDYKLDYILQQLKKLQEDTDIMKNSLNSVGVVSLMDLTTDLKMAEDVEEQTKTNAELNANIAQMLKEKSDEKAANPWPSVLNFQKRFYSLGEEENTYDEIEKEDSDTFDSENTDNSAETTFVPYEQFNTQENQIDSNEGAYDNSGEEITTQSTLTSNENSDEIEKEDSDTFNSENTDNSAETTFVPYEQFNAQEDQIDSNEGAYDDSGEESTTQSTVDNEQFVTSSEEEDAMNNRGLWKPYYRY